MPLLFKATQRQRRYATACILIVPCLDFLSIQLEFGAFPFHTETRILPLIEVGNNDLGVRSSFALHFTLRFAPRDVENIIVAQSSALYSPGHGEHKAEIQVLDRFR